MKDNEPVARTKRFAVEVFKLCAGLPNKPEGWVLGKQLLRSGTSIGANYSEAQRSRTRNEFASKTQICRQEIEETIYWFDLPELAEVEKPARLAPLIKEVQELRAIFTAIRNLWTFQSKTALSPFAFRHSP